MFYESCNFSSNGYTPMMPGTNGFAWKKNLAQYTHEWWHSVTGLPAALSWNTHEITNSNVVLLWQSVILSYCHGVLKGFCTYFVWQEFFPVPLWQSVIPSLSLERILYFVCLEFFLVLLWQSVILSYGHWVLKEFCISSGRNFCPVLLWQSVIWSLSPERIMYLVWHEIFSSPSLAERHSVMAGFIFSRPFSERHCVMESWNHFVFSMAGFFSCPSLAERHSVIAVLSSPLLFQSVIPS